jgi:hypothetical protein
VTPLGTAFHHLLLQIGGTNIASRLVRRSSRDERRVSLITPALVGARSDARAAVE